jgi:hypothetical protein
MTVSPTPETELIVLLDAEGIEPLGPPMRTGTRVDTGGWWRKERLWLVAHREGLILWAPGIKPYLRRLSPEPAARVFFNPLTGCLVLPGENPPELQSLQVLPHEAEFIIQHFQATGPRSVD